jgi:flagellar basal body P-ring protein FlgI
MRQRVQGHRWAWIVGATALAIVAADTPKKNPAKAEKQVYKQEETINDLADIVIKGEIPVEGIGLVVDLDGTGSDPEPGYFRDKLLEKMRKADVPNPEKLLAGSKNYSLVLVRGRIPVGSGKRDAFDIDVELPSGSATTSLAGGKLLLTELRELRIAKNQALEGQVMADVFGPVMTGVGAKPDDPRTGRILGGAHTKKDIPFKIVLKERRKSIATAARVGTIINQRFFEHGAADSIGMANAETDQYIEVRVPRVYHHNQRRYFQIIGLLPIISDSHVREERMARWSKELLEPKTSRMAALKLEGIGRNALAALKPGLTSPDPEVRFWSAEALAYLNETSGVAVLGDSIVSQPALRVAAFDALAALDQVASTMKLRELMSHQDPSIKYGAFRALRLLDPGHAYLGQVQVAAMPAAPKPRDDEDNQPMSFRIRQARQSRVKDPFDLFLVDCDGPPVIHVTRSQRCEIVLFGRKQQLLTPVVLGGDGAILLNASLNDAKIEISRIAAGRSDLPDLKVETSLDLTEVIPQMSRMGASYPQILSVLQSAAKQGNLNGPVVVDSSLDPPAAKPETQLAAENEKNDGKGLKKDDAVGKASLQSPTPRRGAFSRIFRRGN